MGAWWSAKDDLLIRSQLLYPAGRPAIRLVWDQLRCSGVAALSKIGLVNDGSHWDSHILHPSWVLGWRAC